jgi:hypothetical protein
MHLIVGDWLIVEMPLDAKRDEPRDSQPSAVEQASIELRYGIIG